MRVLAVTRHEIGRMVGSMDRRALVAVILAGALIGVTATRLDTIRPDPDAGLYRVAVDGASPYVEVIEASTALRRVPFGEPHDLRIVGTTVTHDRDDARSTAAYDELWQTMQLWLDGELDDEADQDAAFPVRVGLILRSRTVAGGGVADGVTDGGQDGGGGDGGSGLADVDAVRPRDLDPPFPLQSLLLTFVYLVPLNLLGQLYGGALYAERTRQRGRALLSTPLSAGGVLLGRSLPYLAMGAVLLIGATWALGAGWLGLAGASVIVVMVLAMALLAGVAARSTRELTFLIVAATTGLTTFLFLPAMFQAIPAIAFLSPVSVVAAGIRGEAVAASAVLYATLPMAAAAVAFAALGVALYRDDALFSPRTLVAQLLDAIRVRTRRRIGWVAAGAFAVPFALAAELFVIALLVPLALEAAIPLVLIGAAFAEELLKALPALAWRGRMAHAWLAGALVGVGFFLGEKGALLLGLVGFGDIPGGSDALATLGVGSGLLLVAPLILHTLTAALTAVLVQRHPTHAAWIWMPAGVLHVLYNTAILGVV